jgi:hypothetical protein
VGVGHRRPAVGRLRTPGVARPDGRGARDRAPGDLRGRRSRSRTRPGLGRLVRRDARRAARIPAGHGRVAGVRGVAGRAADLRLAGPAEPGAARRRTRRSRGRTARPTGRGRAAARPRRALGGAVAGRRGQQGTRLGRHPAPRTPAAGTAVRDGRRRTDRRGGRRGDRVRGTGHRTYGAGGGQVAGPAAASGGGSRTARPGPRHGRGGGARTTAAPGPRPARRGTDAARGPPGPRAPGRPADARNHTADLRRLGPAPRPVHGGHELPPPGALLGVSPRHGRARPRCAGAARARRGVDDRHGDGGLSGRPRPRARPRFPAGRGIGRLGHRQRAAAGDRRHPGRGRRGPRHGRCRARRGPALLARPVVARGGAGAGGPRVDVPAGPTRHRGKPVVDPHPSRPALGGGPGHPPRPPAPPRHRPGPRLPRLPRPRRPAARPGVGTPPGRVPGLRRTRPVGGPGPGGRPGPAGGPRGVIGAVRGGRPQQTSHALQLQFRLRLRLPFRPRPARPLPLPLPYALSALRPRKEPTR